MLTGRPTRFLALLALLGAVTVARAQTPLVGAEVFQAAPGAGMTATLLAAPAAPDYQWGAAIWYVDRGEGSVTSLFTFQNPVGSTIIPAANPIPSQNGLPLVFAGSFVLNKDLPPCCGQPTTDIPVQFATTGFRPGNNVPPGATPTAAVVFGSNNTATIGFAPSGTSIGSFLDYPVRIGITNVFSGGNGC